MLLTLLLVGLLVGVTNFSLRSNPCYRDGAFPAFVEPPADTHLPLSGEGDDLTTALAGLGFEDLEPLQAAESWRFGIGIPGGGKLATWLPRMGAGWWLGWSVLQLDALPADSEHWQMVRLGQGGTRPPVDQVAQIAGTAPGQVWIIGNEPDVELQDRVTPSCYAHLYHELYTAVKEADPSAQIAVAGVAQGTPLRLDYLDAILEAYQVQYRASLPVDIWMLHGFVLQEHRNEWGVGIPPGLAADTGLLYGVQEHDDLAVFQRHIIAFREWMAKRGYRDRPLVITEIDRS